MKWWCFHYEVMLNEDRHHGNENNTPKMADDHDEAIISVCLRWFFKNQLPFITIIMRWYRARWHSSTLGPRGRRILEWTIPWSCGLAKIVLILDLKVTQNVPAWLFFWGYIKDYEFNIQIWFINRKERIKESLERKDTWSYGLCNWGDASKLLAQLQEQLDPLHENRGFHIDFEKWMTKNADSKMVSHKFQMNSC